MIRWWLDTFAHALALLACLAFPAAAQTRSPWQMHDGLEVTAENPDGLLAFTCSPSMHGDVCEYDVATIPPGDHSGWGPAPDPDVIGFSIYSRVCNAPVTCLAYGDFTYFQTFVDIPANVAVTEFTIAFQGMDDGSRVTIFNSAYPGGTVVPGGYVFLGGSGTADLAALVRSGEVNRVVVTQVDDCCSGNNLQSAVVVLNGEGVSSCTLDADCDDGDPLTADACDPEAGACTHEPLQLPTTTTSSTTTTLPPPDGQPLRGDKLLLKDHPKPRQRALNLVAHDAVDPGGGPGSADDPTAAGGTLRVRTAAGDAFDDVYELPARGWRALARRGQHRGWRYRGKPFRSLLVKQGKLVKMVAKGEALGHTLGADPRPVLVELALGGQRYCWEFGGQVQFKAGRKFLAKKAPAPAGCP